MDFHVVDRFFQLVPKRCTDGKVVQMNELNDYTSEQVKSESGDYETTRRVKIMQLCPGCQGGEHDNPKGNIDAR